ncbi:MAG: PadR family transcriptional regulator [Propionibacteriaceae bacterium]|jgi:PadR family transcriptional regulator PadR|nr:PadR family transcriptional regulator [Propionibacteriaceae bacterium]
MITQLKKGVLELCVLALLKDEDRYGYELITLISEEIHVTAGTVYPLLKRIKAEGYVDHRTVDSPDGPSRKYYSLTERGRAELDQAVAEWLDFYPRVNTMIGVQR